ncbi:MAG TPA: hypothetical protein DCX06_07200 [Opitutae bacterium]|nr:hypothetical protein [Opitutae bacterium]
MGDFVIRCEEFPFITMSNFFQIILLRLLPLCRSLSNPNPIKRKTNFTPTGNLPKNFVKDFKDKLLQPN